MQPPRRIKIAWLVAPFMVKGGTWKHLFNWAKWLPKERFDVTLYYGTGNPAEIRPALEALGVRLVEVPALTPPIRNPVRAITALRQLWRADTPDVVHTLFIQSDILGALAARAAGVRAIVSSVEGRLIQNHVGPVGRAAYKLGYAIAASSISQVLTITGATAREVREDLRFPEHKIRVLYSGIERDDILSSPAVARTRARPVVGAMGELKPPKGFNDLIDAVPGILSSAPSARFRIAGKGESRVALEAQARQLGVADAVEFAGFQQPTAFLDDLDVFVFCSRPNYDGLPWVILEALARGCPIVATSVAGIPEVVRDGIDGILVEAGRPSAIAGAVTRILLDAKLAEQLRLAALRRAHAFTVDREIGELMMIYNELANPN